MGFYNIAYLIKSIFYNMRKSLKYIVFILLFVLLFFMLIKTESKAAVVIPGNNGDITLPDFPSDNDFNPDCILISNSGNILSFINVESDTCIVENGSGYAYFGLSNTSTGYATNSLVRFWSVSNNQWVKNAWQPNNAFRYYSGEFDPANILYSDLDIYTTTATSETANSYRPIGDLIYEANSSITYPYLLSDDGSYLYLTYNTFDAFIIYPGDYIDAYFIFRLQNITNHINGVRPPTIEIGLNKYSDYFVPTSETYGYYYIPKYVLDSNIFKQINGQDYMLTLDYGSETSPIFQTSYRWAFNMSAQVVEDVEQDTQQQINSNLQNLNEEQQKTNDFLTDDTFNSSDISIPPLVINDTQSSFGNQLFDLLRNAFTNDDTPPDFVFTLPFVNKSITFPSNYIESHLPSVIVNLIRTVYWYVICVFIVKDVLRTIDNIRGGDYLLAHEDNIKTEVL